jgi:hypothetical protein
MRRCIRRRNFRDDLANEGIAKGVRAQLTLPARLWVRAPALTLAPLILRAILSQVEGLSEGADNRVVGVEILQLSLRAPAWSRASSHSKRHPPPPTASGNALFPPRLL